MEHIKKRRRKAAPVPYDYEAVYTEDLEGAEITAALDADSRNRGDVYATKEIRAGEQLEIEIYPQFDRTQKHLIPAPVRAKQRKAQKILNARNSWKRCRRLINENFTDRDIWATFTYSAANAPDSLEQAKRDMQNYIRRLNRLRKKRGLQNARYIYVTERGANGKWHHHIILDGDIDIDTIERLWTLGKRNNVRRLERDEAGLAGLAAYITKQGKKRRAEDKGLKTWTPSKGLREPQERVNHKFRRKHIREMVRDFNAVKYHMERVYAGAGYVFTSAAVKYNSFNGRFYIYAQMRRPLEPPGIRRRNRKGVQRC